MPLGIEKQPELPKFNKQINRKEEAPKKEAKKPEVAAPKKIDPKDAAKVDQAVRNAIEGVARQKLESESMPQFEMHELLKNDSSLDQFLELDKLLENLDKTQSNQVTKNKSKNLEKIMKEYLDGMREKKTSGEQVKIKKIAPKTMEKLIELYKNSSSKDK